MKFYLFDRKDKIIHFDDLKILDGKEIENGNISVEMSQNEVYTLQIAVLPEVDDCINEIKSLSDNLDIVCINTDVTDKFGNKKTQQVSLKKNTIQPLFFAITAKKKGLNLEKAEIKFICSSGEYWINANITLNNEQVKNNGYNDLWRLSRLKWLNSTLEQNEELVKPFTPPTIEQNTLSILGRRAELDTNGLPKQIYSYFDEGIEIKDTPQKELFYKPCEFKIGNQIIAAEDFNAQVHKNRIECTAICEYESFTAKITGIYRYDGQCEHSVKIMPKKDFTAGNVSLSFFINKDCSKLMHGLGHRASAAEELCFHWDADKQQDSIFIGTVNCGARFKFKAEDYRRPLINIFYKNLPLIVPTTTWDNNSRGNIKVQVSSECTTILAQTGAMEFKAGNEKSFDFETHITPFKPYDYKKQFGIRYSHNNALTDEIKEIDQAAQNGLNYVIFHQGNMIMPYINYPFYETERLKNAVEYAKAKNIGIKLYYTEREHSNHMAETFVYKALGDEIILRKQGVSHSWQKEKPQWLVDNFGEDIIPGWFVKYTKGKYKGEHDISFIVKPDTRLDNYYIEGLNWLIENIGIKGIYIDDTSLDRTTIERAKKLLDKTNGLIDMHMWNHEEPRAGDVSCLNLYCELLPFLDSIWLGEGFFYKKYSPEYMLCEVSGIPYGIGGQMLQDGGDLYEGMLYAMNNRYGWGYKNATDLYKIWDEFGIADSRMLGYWHSENPIKTDNEKVLTTVYKKDGKALLCVYNFSNRSEKFNLIVNNQLLGFNIGSTEKIKLGSSRRAGKSINKRFRLPKRKGMMLLLEK